MKNVVRLFAVSPNVKNNSKRTRGQEPRVWLWYRWVSCLGVSVQITFYVYLLLLSSLLIRILLQRSVKRCDDV